MKCIHWGSNIFDPSKFQPIKNSHKCCGVKPTGGLWSCPIESSWTFKDWANINDFKYKDFNKFFTFDLSPKAKILIIDSLEDLREKIPTTKDTQGKWGVILDFERLTKNYDAIWLTEKGQAETHTPFSPGIDLYGWDFETVLILNSHVILVDDSTKNLKGIKV